MGVRLNPLLPRFAPLGASARNVESDQAVLGIQVDRVLEGYYGVNEDEENGLLYALGGEQHTGDLN